MAKAKRDSDRESHSILCLEIGRPHVELPLIDVKFVIIYFDALLEACDTLRGSVAVGEEGC
jgi:hypothetical protein